MTDMQGRLVRIINANAFRAFTEAGFYQSELSLKLRKCVWEQTLTCRPSPAEFKKFADSEEQFINQGGSAIFILPSLFNHSCCANVAYFAVGDVMFLCTTRRVEAGAELTVPYLDMKLDYHERKKQLGNWLGPGEGFVCDCERCVPIASIGETPAKRRARADTEAFLRKAYDEVSALVVTGEMSKCVAVERVIPRDRLAAIKRELTALPVPQQDALTVLLEFDIGTYGESGDGRRALQSARQLLAILRVIGSTFDVLKYTLVTLGLEFMESDGPAADAACCQSLRAARALAYPEIPLDRAGNDDFNYICMNYCFMLRNHPRENRLREVISSCEL